MKRIIFPDKTNWTRLSQRPAIEEKNLGELVHCIFNDIKKKGDSAVHKYTKQFDKVELSNARVEENTVLNASKRVPKELKQAIRLAKNNIEKFHASQKEQRKKIKTMPGVTCWRESRAIEKIGIYIPGGTAPLFSTVLMLGIPANLAGCKEIILCTPPDVNGEISPAILFAAKLVGITSIFSVGGVQAIAAMTLGTETIPKVDKLFGPGNQYVTAAKYFAQKFGVAADLPAGPSEVLVIADKSCVPAFVAADLLSQAEHGIDSQVILVTNSEKVSEIILKELEVQLKKLPRKEIAQSALANSKSIVLKSISECIEFSNVYAPEHLILATDKAKSVVENITNAGSVFLGNYSCESAGDYASGTNHTLPTNGFAKNYSGVSLDSFLKKITFQEITKQGIKNIGPAIELMAEAENLTAHKVAVSLRLKNL